MYRSAHVAYPYLLGLVPVAWLDTPARAELALESCPDRRSLDAEHLMRPLVTALERRRVVTSPALILEANAAFLPLSGNPDRELLRST
jgi:hypothetical protein